MDIVTFPGLNLSFQISRIAFQIGSIKIYWYAILIALSFLIAIVALKKECSKTKINYEDILEIMIIAIPIAIISARLYYVIFNLDYYLKNPLEIINIKNGGLAIYGGIIGACITIIICAKKKKIKILKICDMRVPYLNLGQSIGR